MTGKLLCRGMLAGLVAALLSFGFFKVAGEPLVERAIAFENAMEEAKAKAKADEATAKGLPAPAEQAEPELVSRPVQASIGLFTGVAVYGAAFGGLFALAFALAYGRMGDFTPRTTSALLALQASSAFIWRPCSNIRRTRLQWACRTRLACARPLFLDGLHFACGHDRGRIAAQGGSISRLGDWNAGLIAAAAYIAVDGRRRAGSSRRR